MFKKLHVSTSQQAIVTEQELEHRETTKERTGEDAEEEEDVISSQIGDMGRWQWEVTIMASLVGIPAAWHMLVIAFMAPSGFGHWCAPPKDNNWTTEDWIDHAIPPNPNDESSPTYDSCRMYNLTEEELTSWPPQAMDFTNRSQISCSSWEYNRTIFTNTIINQYGIVCDNKYLSQVAQSTYMFGVLIGCVLSGHLADRVGRKPVMLWSVILMLVVGVATSFAPEVISFVILRFITAMAAAALYTTAFVVVMEAVGGHHRPIIGLAYQYPFSIGFMSLAGISWFARDWKHLELAISVPVSVFLLYYWFLPESPRWLYSKKRDAEAKAILDKARKKNKLPPKESSASITPTVHDVDQEDAMKEQHYTILHLFKGPRLRYRTINLFWNWFVNSFVYYGLALNSGNLGGDIFINVFIGGAVEIPAYAISIYVVHRMGRRWPLCLSMVIGGLGCILTTAIPRGVYTNEWPVVTLAMIGKFGISASFAIIYVFSAEIYPTVVRNIGVGSSSMCARIGSIIAPWVAQLEKDLSLQKEHVFIFKGEYTHEFVPIVVFGASSLIAGLLALFLPETKGQRIPETLEDAERVAKKGSGTGTAEVPEITFPSHHPSAEPQRY